MWASMRHEPIALTEDAARLEANGTRRAAAKDKRTYMLMSRNDPRVDAMYEAMRPAHHQQHAQEEL